MSFNSFTDAFSNSPIQTAYSTLFQGTITNTALKINLEWPLITPSTASPFSQTMVIVDSATGGNLTAGQLILPDATLASFPQTAIVINAFGSTAGSSFAILTNDGIGSIAVVPQNTAFFITLVDNSTPDGKWVAYQLAGGTYTPQASVLAGYGLSGLGTLKLNINETVVPLTFTGGSPGTFTQTLDGNDNCAQTGTLGIMSPGAGNNIYQCLSSQILGNGCIFALRNQDTTALGTLSVTPAAGGDTINGSTSAFVLRPGESAYFIADGNPISRNIYTVGYYGLQGTVVNSITAGAGLVAAPSNPIINSGTISLSPTPSVTSLTVAQAGGLILQDSTSDTVTVKANSATVSSYSLSLPAAQPTANQALYATSAGVLTANTLPFSAGGTGETTQPAALTAILGASTIPILSGGTGYYKVDLAYTTPSPFVLAPRTSGTLNFAIGVGDFQALLTTYAGSLSLILKAANLSFQIASSINGDPYNFFLGTDLVTSDPDDSGAQVIVNTDITGFSIPCPSLARNLMGTNGLVNPGNTGLTVRVINGSLTATLSLLTRPASCLFEIGTADA